MTDEEFKVFRKKWDSLFDMGTEHSRRKELEAMSDAELAHFIHPIDRDRMTREEMIDEHLDTVARELGEIEDEDSMDF